MPSNRIRVLLCSSSMDGGGSEKQLLHLLRGLDRERFEPMLYLLHESGVLLDEIPSDVAYIERVLGRSEQYAQNIAGEIIKDMEMATHYPPIMFNVPSGSEVSLIVHDLIATVTHKKNEQASGGAVGGDILPPPID